MICPGKSNRKDQVNLLIESHQKEKIKLRMSDFKEARVERSNLEKIRLKYLVLKARLFHRSPVKASADQKIKASKNLMKKITNTKSGTRKMKSVKVR